MLTTEARTPDLQISSPRVLRSKFWDSPSSSMHTIHSAYSILPNLTASIVSLREYKLWSCSPLSFCFLCVPKPHAHMGLRHQCSYEPDFCAANLSARQASKHNVNTVQVTLCFLSLSQLVDGRSMLINWFHFSKYQNFTYSQHEWAVTNYSTYESSAETDRHRLYLRACCITTRKIVT